MNTRADHGQPTVTRLLAAVLAATTLSVAAAGPSAAVESPPGSDVLEPDGAEVLAEHPTAEALEYAVGLPADLADTAGELVHFSADIRNSLSEIRFTVIVEPAPLEAIAGALADLEADGWTTTGDLDNGPGFTATRDIDGVDDGNLDGIGEQSILVEATPQPDGSTTVTYMVSDHHVDLTSSTVADSALFTGIREAAVDPVLAFESASLTATMRPFTRTGGFGTSTTSPGVAFTSRYQAPVGEAERLVLLLDDICTWPGHQCTGDPSLQSADRASVWVRMPDGDEGTLSVAPMPEDGIAVVQFFVSFGLDTGVVVDPTYEPSSLPVPADVDDPAEDKDENDTGAAVPPKAGEEQPDAPSVEVTKAAEGRDLTAIAAAIVVIAALAAAWLIGRPIVRRRRRRRRETAAAVVEPADQAEEARATDPIGELAGAFLAAGARARPRLVQVDDERVEVCVSASAATPEGWTSPAPSVFVQESREALGSGSFELLPLAVRLACNESDVDLFIDLEGEERVDLLGQAEAVTGFLVDLLTRLQRRDIEVCAALTEARAHPLLGALDDVERAEMLAGVADRAARRTALLAERDWPSVFAARFAEPGHPGLRPAVVVTDEPLPTELLSVGDAPGWGAVTVLSLVPSGGTPVCFSEAGVELPSLGLHADRLLPSGQDDPADEGTVDVTDAAVATAEPRRGDESVRPARRPVEIDAAVVVRLLGDIRVEGGRQLTARQAAVLSYIATHPGAGAGRIVDSVWPNAAMTSRRKTLSNTVSEIRTAIGKDLMPGAADGRYRTGDGLVTDIDVFDDFVRRAEEVEGTERAELLRSALDLVDGPPFRYPEGTADLYVWVDVENQVASWEGRIRRVVRDCVDLYIAVGEPGEAAVVANAALAALPTDALITEMLMRAHSANGDVRAIRSVFAAHGRSLEALDLDTVQPTTTALYDDLVPAGEP